MMKPRESTAPLAAAAVLAWSARRAQTGEVSAGEERVFRWFNQAPDRFETKVWTVMQAGNFAGRPRCCRVGRPETWTQRGFASCSRRTSVWLIGKLFKAVVHRGRPEQLLSNVIVRG